MTNQLGGLQFLIILSYKCLGMEIIEMFGWIALGFVPMLSGLEIFGRKLPRRGERKKVELRTYIREGGTIFGL